MHTVYSQVQVTITHRGNQQEEIIDPPVLEQPITSPESHQNASSSLWPPAQMLKKES